MSMFQINQPPQVFHQTALNLFQQGQVATAIETLEKAISIYPQVKKCN